MGVVLMVSRWMCRISVAIMLALYWPPDSLQAAFEIRPATVRYDSNGRMSFQFDSAGQQISELTIETAPTLGKSISWSEEAGASIEMVADGLYQASLIVRDGNLFCRVRLRDLPPAPARVLINEVMTDNVASFADLEGRFWDWVELYNPNDEAVDLAGYALSDDLTVPGKWLFPSALMQPHGFLVVYASDLNQTNAVAALHTNFKLKASGELLILSDAALRELDRMAVPALGSDQSIGRAPDGAADLQFYTRTTASPGKENLATGAGPALASPTFEPESGIFDSPISVHLQGAESNHVVRFTLDGSAPSVQSPVFSTNLVLTESRVIRAMAFGPRGETSALESRSYLIGVQHSLPIVSIATPASHLAFRDGYLYGMGSKVLSAQNQVLQNYPYSGSNAWQDREVEIAIEFFETNRTVAFRQRAGMKIFGGWGSRAYPQKSLALFARRSYGAGKFAHRVFPDQNVDQFEALVLRSSGNDNQGTQQTPPRPPISEFGPTTDYGSYFVNGQFTLMRDALMQRLIQGTTLDTQAYRPAVVYVNGEYWGLYNLREKLTEDYLVAHHDLAPGTVDLIEAYGTVNAGTGSVYTQMRQYLSSKNMADPASYAFVSENFLDIDNFIDYHLAVIYFQNFDIGNIKCWRPRSARGLFRWLVFDQDYGFNLWPPEVYVPAMARDYSAYDNMFDFYTGGTGTSTAWPNAGGRTLLLRSLLKNPQFKEKFIRRCADLLNSLFREERVAQTAQEMATVIRPEISDHLKRWSWAELTRRGFGKPHQAEHLPFTQATWETNITTLSKFGRERPAKLRQDCIEHFQLRGGLGTLEVQTEPAAAGRIAVNSLVIDAFPWNGVYFADITNSLQASPVPGYRFIEWSTVHGAINQPILSYQVASGKTNRVVARFETAAASPAGESALKVTEIQYHSASAQDSGDWVELYNAGAASVNLSGWILRDGSDDHAFLLPPVELAPGASLVACQDKFRFRLFHSASVPVAGDFGFGLDNSGGMLRLFRPDGSVAVSIRYDDEAPWPSGADGTGFTLQLIAPELDPALPTSWKVSTVAGGTPGQL